MAVRPVHAPLLAERAEHGERGGRPAGDGLADDEFVFGEREAHPPGRLERAGRGRDRFALADVAAGVLEHLREAVAVAGNGQVLPELLAERARARAIGASL